MVLFWCFILEIVYYPGIPRIGPVFAIEHVDVALR